MCGIAGIIHLDEKPVEQTSIRKMIDAITHRGPDGEGIFIEKNIGLGHKRLSIIDVSDISAQPMHWHHKYVITYNGEIYNYIEIKKELEQNGYLFSSTGDTEVILAAYDKWGTECVKKFNGMWAFAIYDKTYQKIFCSRDRFGVKPFYYAISNNTLYFASEIKAILTNINVSRLNQSILLQYLVLNLTDHTTSTFFNNISTLSGGHNLIVDLQQQKYYIEKYYNIQFHQHYNKLNINEAIDIFRTEFERSISWRLRSDVKVGTCLSGGLDSSYIAAIASKKYTEVSNEPFTAITAEALQNDINEKYFAEKVVNHLGLNWYVTSPGHVDFQQILEQVIYTQEEPFGSPSIILQNFVMQQAKQANVKVLLDGQGADEILLGYPRYIAAYVQSLPFSKKISFFKNAKHNYGLSIKTILLNYLYFSNFNLRKQRVLKNAKGIHQKYIQAIDFNILKLFAKANSDIYELQLLEVTTTQIPQLLKWEDKNSMAHSIETRLPFLDYQLVELCLSIQNSFKLQDGWSKYILRKNMNNILPKEIVWRKKKIGFNAPNNLWIPDKKPIYQAIQNSPSINTLFKKIPSNINNASFEWRLYNIALWEKVFNIEI